MFVWADAASTPTRLPGAMLDRGYLMAPGSLFTRPASEHVVRFNIANSTNPAMLAAADATLQGRAFP